MKYEKQRWIEIYGTPEYRDGWERIFGHREDEEQQEDEQDETETTETNRG